MGSLRSFFVVLNVFLVIAGSVGEGARVVRGEDPLNERIPSPLVDGKADSVKVDLDPTHPTLENNVPPLDKESGAFKGVLAAPDGLRSNAGWILSSEHSNLDLARSISEWPSKEDPFGLARMILEKRLSTAQAVLPAEVGAHLEASLAQEKRNLDLAEEITHHPSTGDPLRDAVEIAKRATEWEAKTLGLSLPPIELPHHTLPSEALEALLSAHSVTPTPDELDSLRSLDNLPHPTREALTRFLDAFLAYDREAQIAFSGTNRDALLDLEKTLPLHNPNSIKDLESLGTDPSSLPFDLSGSNGPSDLSSLGIDLAPVLSARNALLETLPALRDALRSAPAAPCSTNRVWVRSVFSIDLSSCDNLYTEDVALLLDAGGNDTYTNNAGGSANMGAAALVDLGEGADRYGDRQNPRSYGVNGGGYGGVGFLFDGGGDDVYSAGSYGTNGGGYVGVGFLLDQGGNDTYLARHYYPAYYDPAYYGTNGGGSLGVGFLLDQGGNDTYSAGGSGTNGGGYLGVGFLLDQGGDDRYNARWDGTNGGGYLGVGFLLDQGGNDAYSAGGWGTNGGGDWGVGFLIDQGGNDAYSAGGWGTNGGGDWGVGFLIDQGGNDIYSAENWGTNGGAVSVPLDPLLKGLRIPPALGFLLDQDGNDFYSAGSSGTNGGGAYNGTGFLLDRNGNDTYEAGSYGANGGGSNGGLGFLLDENGNDTYNHDYPMAIQISLGWFHTCALLQNKNVTCWGYNWYGQSNPYTGGDAVAVSAGSYHTCALLRNGNVWCWGGNSSGQSNPYLGGDAIAVSAGRYHTCALLRNGNVKCWGANWEGQSNNPSFGGNVTAVSAGGFHTCALLEDSNVKCWGSNTYGHSNPYTGGDAIAVSAGDYHTCALLRNGNVRCWGYNGDGPSNPYTGGDAIAVSAGDYHTCALLRNGNVRCWGYNGDGPSNPYTGGNAIAVSAGDYHTCALLRNGNVLCWGDNAYGQAAPYPGGYGVNGGGSLGGVGFLLDLSGNDTYVAGDSGTNGGSRSSRLLSPSASLLLDLGGRDTYRDSTTNCTDCSVVPKGFVGAQVDVKGPV